MHRVVLHVQKTVADDAVVLAVLDVGPPDVAMPNHPFVGNDLLQTVHRDVNQNERVRNMPVARQKRAPCFRPLCLRPAAREFAVAIGADHAHIQRHLAFAADGAVAALALGVANAVGVVDADGRALPVACVVGKVLH